MNYGPVILSILKGLGSVIKTGFLALFLIRTGGNKEVLKGKKKEVDDAKEAGKLKNHIANLSDTDLNDGLRAKRSTKE